MTDPLPLSYEGGFRFGEIEIAARMWYTCAGETGIHGRYDTIRFETERPILRNYTTDDAPAAHEYFSDEEVLRYEVFWPQSVEEAAYGLSGWKDMDDRMGAGAGVLMDGES